MYIGTQAKWFGPSIREHILVWETSYPGT